MYRFRRSNKFKSKSNYELLSKYNLVGILFFLLVQASEISKINNIKYTKSKTGFYGQLGNKGSCFVKFVYDNKTYGIKNGHLVAGKKIFQENSKGKEVSNNLNINFTISIIYIL